MKPFLLILMVMCLVCRADAQRWAQLNPPGNLFTNTIFSTVVDRTGKVYAAGRATDSSGQYVVAGFVDGGVWSEVGGTKNLRASGVIYSLALDSSDNLYAGGAFTDATGNYYIARWDGKQWSGLGVSGGVQATGQVFCMATDKAGNVYAAGELIDSVGNYYVAKWDGNSWTRLGAGVNALAANGPISSVLPDGAGNVYAAGQFKNAGGNYFVAKWNGVNWSEVGGGSGALNANSYINSLTRDGVGNIYAAGDFKDAGGYRYVAKWDGSKWTELGTGSSALQANGPINSILTDDSGRINAAGFFTDTFANYNVMRWGGAGWTEAPHQIVHAPANGYIYALSADAMGNLYAAGDFMDGNGNRYVAKLSGNVWNQPGYIGGSFSSPANQIRGMAADTAGNVFAVSGNDETYGVPIVDRWDGRAWNAVSSLVGNGFFSITNLAPDSLGNMYATGSFADGYGVAKWNGNGWTELPLPPGAQTYYSITSIATDKKGNVYIADGYDAGGGGVGFAKWDGNSWQTYGYSVPYVYCFIVDSTGTIYAANVDYGQDTYNIIRVASDGTQTSLGGGPGKYFLNANTWVHAMAFDRGGNLYAGGGFLDSTGNTYIAKWDGQSWTKIGSAGAYGGFGDGTVTGIVFDNDGNLFASCRMLGSEGTLIGKWDGHAWTAITDTGVFSLENALNYLGRDSKGIVYAGGQQHVYYCEPVSASQVPPVDTCTKVAGVGLKISADTVNDQSGSVVLSAGVVSGGGTATNFVFATDAGFTHTLGGVSADSVVSVAVRGLSLGVNHFYVRMQTTNSCDSVLTAVDSVVLIKVDTVSGATAVTDTAKMAAGPNPFVSTFTVTALDASVSYTLLLMNSDGVKVYSLQVSGQTSVQVRGLSLKQGIYWLQLYNNATGQRVWRMALLKE